MASENLKKFILVLAQGAMQGEKSFADGWQLKDIFDFYPQILQIPAISFPIMATEVQARTEATNKDVQDFLIKELDLQNDRAEHIVETGFIAIVSVDNFITALRSVPVVVKPL